MSFRMLKKLLFPAILALAFAGCSALEEPVSSLDDGISKMLTLPVGSTYHTERVLSSSEPEYIITAASIDSTMGTNFKIYEIGDAQTFSEGYTLGLSSSSIWLGSILDASGLPENNFDEVVFDRAPYTFSISLKGNGTCVAGRVNGSRSDYEQKMSDFLTPDVLKAQPGTAEYTIESIYSKEDLIFKIGFGLGVKSDDVKFKLDNLFDFNNKKIKTRVLIKFNQVYYSATIDKPSRPSKLFVNGLQFSEFQSKLSGNVSPVYISSIKYGRMGYLTVESEETEDVVNDALNMALSTEKVNIDLGLSVTVSNVFKSSKIRVSMVGGGLSAVSNITGGLDGFLNWIKQASGEKDISSGVPVAFEMTYLKNNRQAGVYKMNKQYAVIWNKAKYGYRIRNLIISDCGWGIKGNVYVKYFNSIGNLITNIVNTRNYGVLELGCELIVNPEMLSAGRFVIGFDNVCEDILLPVTSLTKWSANIQVDDIELQDNEYKYVNWYQYSSGTGVANYYSKFSIEPITNGY